ncbi:MAG: hypothetical protein KDC13_02675, partial [Bacteroidetes bacterium]|nr:hypothetical protein [Bacteroidota bacterium]
ETELSVFLRNATDINNPVIEISSPVESAVFQSGESIPVQAEISDNLKLTRIQIEVFQSGSLVFSDITEIDQTDFQINSEISTTGFDAGNYMLRVSATDGVNNISSAEREFTLIN